MTDHEPDARLNCWIYVSVIAFALVIFAFGVYIGTMI